MHVEMTSSLIKHSSINIVLNETRPSTEMRDLLDQYLPHGSVASDGSAAARGLPDITIDNKHSMMTATVGTTLLDNQVNVWIKSSFSFFFFFVFFCFFHV